MFYEPVTSLRRLNVYMGAIQGEARAMAKKQARLSGECGPAFNKNVEICRPDGLSIGGE